MTYAVRALDNRPPRLYRLVYTIVPDTCQPRSRASGYHTYGKRKPCAGQITLDLKDLTLDDFIDVARNHAEVGISQRTLEAIAKTAALIDSWVENSRTIYGVTTGFGALSDVSISREDAARLQTNILMSHAAGVGRSAG